MRVLESQLRTPGPLVFARPSAAERLVPPGIQPIVGWAPMGTPTEQAMVRRGEVLYPRHIPGVGTRMVRTPVEAIPKGWQTVTARVPTRLATCEETDCPMWLQGWTEVLTADGNRHQRLGHISRDEAAGIFGVYGPAATPPAVIHHPPGPPCGRVHKLPSGAPPAYQVNGRWVLWNEFEDALGGGLHRAQRIKQEGRY